MHWFTDSTTLQVNGSVKIGQPWRPPALHTVPFATTDFSPSQVQEQQEFVQERAVHLNKVITCRPLNMITEAVQALYWYLNILSCDIHAAIKSSFVSINDWVTLSPLPPPQMKHRTTELTHWYYNLLPADSCLKWTNHSYQTFYHDWIKAYTILTNYSAQTFKKINNY